MQPTNLILMLGFALLLHTQLNHSNLYFVVDEILCNSVNTLPSTAKEAYLEQTALTH